MAVKAYKPQKAVKVDRALEEFRKIARTRYKMAMQVYEAQDGLTKEVIDRIRDRLVIASTGVVNINGRPVKIEQKYVDYNILFLACEILSDLALLDIQIANFNPSPMWCAECKQEIAGVKNLKGRNG